MSGTLSIQNRQRAVAINLRSLRWLTRTLLQDVLAIADFDLAIYLVNESEMIHLNETHLQHQGSTDVITFDYADQGKARDERGEGRSDPVHGEIFICMAEAVAQARAFKTTWQSEVVRYVIHGVLHLLGFDDHKSIDQRRMKREEDRLLREMEALCPFSNLAQKPDRR